MSSFTQQPLIRIYTIILRALFVTTLDLCHYTNEIFLLNADLNLGMGSEYVRKAESNISRKLDCYNARLLALSPCLGRRKGSKPGLQMEGTSIIFRNQFAATLTEEH